MRRTTYLLLCALIGSLFLCPATTLALQQASQPRDAAAIAEPAHSGTGSKSEAPAERELRFAVVGDTGTGDKYQYAVANQMSVEYERSPFEFVLMLGDNNYLGSAKNLKKVFDEPYKPLLEHGVRFYATLGNHDERSSDDQEDYDSLGMGGKRNYSFKPAGDLVEFFTIDTTLVVEKGDTTQLAWLDKALHDSKARWKIVFAHHPPYSPGRRHGDNPILIEKLVPILQRNGVRVVLTGHEHFFARMRQVGGIDYLISGSGGKIHKGGLREDPRLVAGNDSLHQFLSVTLTRDAFTFTTIGEDGETIYQGTIPYDR